jgi:hypothetical protein
MGTAYDKGLLRSYLNGAHDVVIYSLVESDLASGC